MIQINDMLKNIKISLLMILTSTNYGILSRKITLQLIIMKLRFGYTWSRHCWKSVTSISCNFMNFQSLLTNTPILYLWKRMNTDFFVNTNFIWNEKILFFLSLSFSFMHKSVSDKTLSIYLILSFWCTILTNEFFGKWQNLIT